LGVNYIPWDSTTFGMKAYEIDSYNEELLKQTTEKNSHYTIKVNPLCDKSLLHKYSFYYVDTLLQPSCKEADIHLFISENLKLRIDTNHYKYDINLFEKMIEGLFQHGRFHRDFNINKEDADTRYKSWFKQIFDTGSVHVCLFEENVVGFMAYKDNNLLLTGLDKSIQGKGLAKYFWSESFKEIFKNFSNVVTSVSSTNLSVLNLYNSLGFKFNNPMDVYHKYNN
jgi:ribosomal protein S18 acetylase RimI-like enzyme